MLKFRNILPIFFIITIISVTVRFLQSYSMIDPRTGFFKPEFSALNIAISIAFGVVLLLFLVLGFKTKDKFSETKNKSPVLCASSMFLAFALMIEGGIMLNDGSFYAISKETGANEFQLGTLLGFTLLTFSVLAFCVYAVNLARDKKSGGFLLIFPVFYWAYRLITAFITYTGIANISENIIYIAMLCFSLVFLLSHGKIIADINPEKSIKSVLAYGFGGAMLCFVSIVPRFLLTIIGQQDLIHEGILGKPLDLILGVYIVIFMCVQMGNKSVAKIEE